MCENCGFQESGADAEGSESMSVLPPPSWANLGPAASQRTVDRVSRERGRHGLPGASS